MSKYIAIVEWQRNQAKFIDNKYSREHTWQFDGGAVITASSSPSIVPAPYSNPYCIDPEEAFIASLSSCHMLWFLSIAAEKKFIVESYSDHAVGIMNQNETEKLAFTKILLRPRVTFSNDTLPTILEVKQMHSEAHDSCFLASSVNAEIIIEVIST